VFSTEQIPLADRLDAWLCYARQICGDCRFHFPKHLPFGGSIDRRNLTGATFSRFSSTPVSFVKFPAFSADSADRDCIVITQLRGTRRYCQGGAVAILSPGDTTLIDAGQPWTSDCVDTCARLYLRVPRWLIEERLERTQLPLLPRILGKRSPGATLFHLGTSLYAEAGTTLPEDSGALDTYLYALAGCLDAPEWSSTELGRCTQLRPRIEHYIENHLQEKELDPASIAAAAGVSVRHLHRLFAAKGCTVAEWIRERRLERCRSELSDPRNLDGKITDIALHWGFVDAAHFSHCFRKEFGTSPRQFRADQKARANTSC